jgi:hypothetical protein
MNAANIQCIPTVLLWQSGAYVIPPINAGALLDEKSAVIQDEQGNEIVQG